MQRQRTPRLAVAIFASVCALVPHCRAQAAPVPVLEQLLRGPDRRDFPWKTQLIGPRLTFQQRNLVQVRAHVPIAAHSSARDLDFLVKVADKDGHWFAGEDGNRYAVVPNIGAEKEVQFTCGLYLRAGSYTVAIVVYDAAHRQANVTHKKLRVEKLKHDPLPQLDRDLPAVEFLHDVPSSSVHELRRFQHDDAWALGQGREWLPVQNPAPVRIDLVLNLSNWMDPRFLGQVSTSLYQQRVAHVLQVGSVLSHLRLARGCVRISAVDLPNARILYDRSEAAGFDWHAAQQSISPTEQFKVDLNVLEEHKQTATLFRRYLSEILYNSGGCGGTAKPRRVMILVGEAYVFPEGARAFGVWPEMPCDCRFYYLRTDAAPFDDSIEEILKRVQPWRVHLKDSRDFRKALARLIADLEKK